MKTYRWLGFVIAAAAGLFLFAGCSDDQMSEPQSNLFGPAGSAPTAMWIDDEFLDDLKAGAFTICKVAEGATMKFTFNTLAEGPGVASAPVYEPTVMLGHMECADVYVAPEVSDGADTVTINEVVPEGYEVIRVGVWSLEEQADGALETTFHELPAGTTEVSGMIEDGKLGCVVIFYNAEIPTECTGEIGDFVWNDTGGTKGIQDQGEPGIEGVRVVLMDAAGAVLAETTTGADGYYLFTGLCAGDYKVTVDESTIPEGWMQTPTEVGDDRCVDNNPNPAMVTLPEDDASNLCIDFGYMEPVVGPGVGTPGYWHKPRRWPVDTIEIGGMTYTKYEAAMYLTGEANEDKSITMFRQLVATKLNVIIGNEYGCVEGTIDFADDWMADYPVGSGVDASSQAWKDGEWAKDELDAYNNGRLCAEGRD